MEVTSGSQTDRYKPYSYISTRWHKSFEQQRRARHEMQIRTKQTKNLYWQKVVMSSFLLALVLWRSSGTEYYLFAAILSPSQAGQRLLKF